MAEKDTENRIKEAARKIFQQKGFAATKTRDIAEEAGINLALLNYYFRSKKKLFDIIMVETMQSFFAGLFGIINHEKTSLREKIQLAVEIYIDFLSENPDIPSFILNEVRQKPEEFAQRFGILEKMTNSFLLKQFAEEIQAGTVPPINPMHFMFNLPGLVVFPFIAAPVVSNVTGIPRDAIIEVIQERKRLIPLWINEMLKVH